MRTLVAVTTLLILLVSCRTQQGSGSARAPAAGEAGGSEAADASLRPAAPGSGDGAPPLALPSLPAEPARQARQEERIERLLATLTLRQKIGQRFMTGFPGKRIGDRASRLIREGYVGGLLLTRGNIQNRGQIKELTAALQAAAGESTPPIGLFIGIDQEGGRVSRLDLDNVTRFAAPYYWTEYRDPWYVESIAYIAGREALALGCNMNFAPVLDLYSVPDDSVIGDRSMGTNPFRVGEQGVFYLYGARRAGIAAVVKHFPGHGTTSVDSHRQLPVVQADEGDLWKRDLIPFQIAVDHGVEAIMTAHLLLPKLDPDYPATLSQGILRGLLRGRLGFDGLVVTDDIDMGALRNHYSPVEVLEHSILAGADLILGSGGLDTLELIRQVEELVETGVLSEELIDEGVRRILRLKLQYGLVPVVEANEKESGS